MTNDLLDVTPEQEASDLYSEGYRAKEKGNLSLAFDNFLRAVDLQPHVAPYRLQLALTAYEMSKPRDFLLDTAHLNAQEAARMQPDVLGNWVALGEICLHCNKFPEAIAAYEKCLMIDPNRAFLHSLLGFAHSRNGQPEKAIAAHEHALSIDPELGLSHFLLAVSYHNSFFNPTKLAYHGERAFMAKAPCSMPIEAMWNSAQGFLLTGDYEKGFQYFESRLQRNATNVGHILASSMFKVPLWRGEKSKEKRLKILVHAEMGFGDVFIMMRYLPLICLVYGVDVIFACMPQMLGFAQFNFPDIRCIPLAAATDQECDYYLPMMSLPVIFRTRSDTVPGIGPMRAPSSKIEQWRSKLKLCKNQPNVAICWYSGQNSHRSDTHEMCKAKSIPFDMIRPIVALEGINFISLQVENDADFPNPGIRDFSDTAAIIHLCDLIITVDTAVANLAGAMGANVWLMDRFDHCWRWSNIKSPWYPTACVYRQGRVGYWDGVISQITDDLKRIRGKIAG